MRFADTFPNLAGELPTHLGKLRGMLSWKKFEI